MPNRTFLKHLPNFLTLSRIAIVPFVIYFIYLDTWGSRTLACVFFILASITDYFDGFLARKYQIVSSIGKFIDPVADKVLVSSTLIMLIPSGKLGPIMVLILVARDSVIDGLRSVAVTQNIIISAAKLGKWKTAIQMVAIPCVLYYQPLFGIPVYEIGYWILWISVGFSVISGYRYVHGFLTHKSFKP